jgi:hypothetical protein
MESYVTVDAGLAALAPEMTNQQLSIVFCKS